MILTPFGEISFGLFLLIMIGVCVVIGFFVALKKLWKDFEK